MTTEAQVRRRGTAGDAKPAKRKRKFPYRKVPDLEADIAATEKKVADLEAALQIAGHLPRRDPRPRHDGRPGDGEGRAGRLYQHWEEAVELNG